MLPLVASSRTLHKRPLKISAATDVPVFAQMWHDKKFVPLRKYAYADADAELLQLSGESTGRHFYNCLYGNEVCAHFGTACLSEIDKPDAEGVPRLMGRLP